jgi:hypothetical protein
VPVPHRLTIDQGDVVVVRAGCREGELGYTRMISRIPVPYSVYDHLPSVAGGTPMPVLRAHNRQPHTECQVLVSLCATVNRAAYHVTSPPVPAPHPPVRHSKSPASVAVHPVLAQILAELQLSSTVNVVESPLASSHPVGWVGMAVPPVYIAGQIVLPHWFNTVIWRPAAGSALRKKSNGRRGRTLDMVDMVDMVDMADVVDLVDLVDLVDEADMAVKVRYEG